MKAQNAELILELLLLKERYGERELRETLKWLESDDGSNFFSDLMRLLERCRIGTGRKGSRELTSTDGQEKVNRAIQSNSVIGRARRSRHTEEQLHSLSIVQEYLAGHSLDQLRAGAGGLGLKLPKRIVKQRAIERIALRLSEEVDEVEVVLERLFGGPPEPDDAFQSLAGAIMDSK